jgi:hypothetical protein
MWTGLWDRMETICGDLWLSSSSKPVAALVSSAAAQKAPNSPEPLGARDMFYQPVQAETPSGGPPGKALPAGKGKSGKKAAPTHVPPASVDRLPEPPPVPTSQVAP